MVKIGAKGSIQVNWRVNSYDYTKSKAKDIAQKFANKYGIPVNNVKVIPELVTIGSDGKAIQVSNDIVLNIQDPKFQQGLFKEYLDVNKVEGYDFDEILKIDADINSTIDYGMYDKFRRYSINWLKMSNFLSYGPDNYFDFNSLSGLVLLNGEPANQSGKTTFAIDAIKFALFGKTDKAPTLDKVFNKHIPEATEVLVECGLTIEGTQYVIRRRITRPALSKRTAKSKVVQNVEYFRYANGEYEAIEDSIENERAENSQQTNKVIKESIGREEDFDLIISITGTNLDDLITKKDTERGKLLSRWIGLLPLEEKDVKARERFNQTIKPNLLSNRYNEQTLVDEIQAYHTQTNVLSGEIAKFTSENDAIDGELSTLEGNRNALLVAKQSISPELMSVNIEQLRMRLENVKNSGVNIGNEVASIDAELASIGDVDFNINEYDGLNQRYNTLVCDVNNLSNILRNNNSTIETLTKGEFCPTCGKKLDNVDNKPKIDELKRANQEISSDMAAKSQMIDECRKSIELQMANRERFDKKNRLEVTKGAKMAERERLRSEYLTISNTINEYNKNCEAIDKNNRIDEQLRNLDFEIVSKKKHKETNISYIASHQMTIKNYGEQIDVRTKLIESLKAEEVVVRNWRIYLDLVGKNGISKMVLRNALPIINARLATLLSDVCDFDVEVAITDKNDVVFNIIKDGVVADISSGSGYEKTTSAMALRAVLASVSSIPRCNCLVLDELWGRVAKENLGKIRDFLEKILVEYDFIIQVSHLDEVKDWNNSIITVKKDGNVSSLTRCDLK